MYKHFFKRIFDFWISLIGKYSVTRVLRIS